MLGTNSAQIGHCFFRKETRGLKDVEQKIGKIAIPVDMLQEMCTFTPFPQQLDHFPGHEPRSTSKCICGIIDPDSPAMLDPPAMLERIPLRAVEAELHERGLCSDSLQSDMQHLDKSDNGSVGPEDLVALKSYGQAVGSPEQINELRDALLKRFGNLNVAFDACCSVAQNLEITDADNVSEAGSEAVPAVQNKRQKDSGIDCAMFEKFLNDAVEKCPKKEKAKGAPLKAWLEKASSEEIQEVFTSINVSEGATIDLLDFLTLSLHTAMASMQRLAHFQKWIIQKFGRSQDAFERAFDTVDQQHRETIGAKQFMEGVQAIGYTCGPTVLNCIFSLLDRNFKGSITVKELENLRSFNSAKLVQGLQDLKQFADNKFGGVDACFASLLKMEKVVKNLPGKAKTVSLKTFEKALMQGGFKQAFADADLELLFLFLDEASDQSTSGCLTYLEWQLLRGFEARAFSGSPARLRRFLEQQFGDMQEAYKQLQASWQARVVRERLTQAALNGLVRAMRNCASDGKRANFRNVSTGVGAAMSKAMMAARAITPSVTTDGTEVAKKLLSRLGSKQKTDDQQPQQQPLQRPHTHEGTRNPNPGRGPASTPDGASSARRPGSRGVTYLRMTAGSPPSYQPSAPQNLRTARWEPMAAPSLGRKLWSLPQSARCQSAPSGEQKGLMLGTTGVSLPGMESQSRQATPRCKLQGTETQHGFTALRFNCGRASSNSSRGGWDSSQRGGAVSAINWAVI